MNTILNILNILLSIGATILGIITIIFADSPTKGHQQASIGFLLFAIPVINILAIFLGKYVPISKTSLHAIIFVISLAIAFIVYRIY